MDDLVARTAGADEMVVTESDVKDAQFVCMLDELAPGTMLRFDLRETPLVVCRSEATGEVFAIGARCPHRGALLCYGKLTGMQINAGSNRHTYVRAGEIIRCPLHLWDFDVRTGQSLRVWPPYQAPTYPVQIKDGKIYVSPHSREKAERRRRR